MLSLRWLGDTFKYWDFFFQLVKELQFEIQQEKR